MSYISFLQSKNKTEVSEDPQQLLKDVCLEDKKNKEKAVKDEAVNIVCPDIFSPSPPTNDKVLWENICKEFEIKKNLVEDYMKKKNNKPTISPSPTLQYMQNNVFSYLMDGMHLMVEKAIEEDSLYIPKTTFDGIDFLCEYLYNNDPFHPERKEHPIPFLELDWVKKILKDKPRPFYPKSRLWSNDYAAKIIQKFVRGHWLRSREEVQELRQFWRNLEEQKNPRTKIVESLTDEIKNEAERILNII